VEKLAVQSRKAVLSETGQGTCRVKVTIDSLYKVYIRLLISAQCRYVWPWV